MLAPDPDSATDRAIRTGWLSVLVHDSDLFQKKEFNKRSHLKARHHPQSTSTSQQIPLQLQSAASETVGGGVRAHHLEGR
jgi:hypothetical protein